MPSAGDKTKPRLISQKVDASYHVVITCDVEVDLSDPELHVEFPLANVPFAGDWKLRIYLQDGVAKVDVVYGLGEAGRIGSDVVLSVTVASLRNGVEQRLRVIEWAKEPLPSVEDQDGEPYEVSSSRLKPELWPSFAREGLQHFAPLAARLADLHLEQLPSQLRLFFPNVSKDGAELWVSSDLLVKTAPYFKDLLSSDFSEATPRRSKRARKSGAQPLPAPASNEKDFDDSDDETDAFLLKKKPPKLSESTEACDLSFREITITQSSFSTYHALLVYLESGYIRMAPLRSPSSPSNPFASSTRLDFLSQYLGADSSLPLPVSLKSLYRLADLLRLPDSDPLSSLCLRAFADSLTHHGAALELFSDISVCFDKLRKVVLEYVVKNWDAVSETASWKEMKKKVKRDEVAGVVSVMVELMDAREEAAKKETADKGKA